MRYRNLVCKGLVLCLAMGTRLIANDGVDRYRKAVPNTFQLFPQPASPEAGYGILAQDMKGGADGDIRHRWAQPHAVDLVRVAARAVARDLGPGPHPLLIMDASSENGDTPVQFDPAPLGRHPGGSHDGGLNLDLGYYLTSLHGKVYTPDFAAATEHFEARPDGSLKDVPQCLGPADRLDVPRTARFFVEIFRLHREAFRCDLLEEIGVDFQVRQPVIAQVRQWAATGKFAANQALVDDMEMVLTSDEANGWAKTHHHHLHLRIRDLPTLGMHRGAIASLCARARKEEAELRAAAEARPGLAVSLLSTDLSRSLEAELLPTGVKVKELRFRVDGSSWRHAQPGDARNRAVLDLPRTTAAGKVLVEAEGLAQDGKPFQLQVAVDLPEQNPRLGIAVDPAALKADVKETPEGLRIQPRVPASFRAWVTETALVLHREGQKPERRVLEDAQEQVVDAKGLRKVELQVICSGRKAALVPVWIKI